MEEAGLQSARQVLARVKSRAAYPILGIAMALATTVVGLERTSFLTHAVGGSAVAADSAISDSALAAAGAVVYAIYYNLLQWNLGFRFGIIAFTAAVLGGIGNILGAGLGGFLIGLIYVFGSDLLGGEWGNSIIFAMLILVLTLRPSGLLGMRVPDRA